MTRIRLLTRVLCAVPLVGAMVFGTAQAFASPGAILVLEPGAEPATQPR